MPEGENETREGRGEVNYRRVYGVRIVQETDRWFLRLTLSLAEVDRC